MNENFDPIWHTPPPKFNDWTNPMPFEFNWEVYDKTGEEIKVTVSGFWNFYYKNIDELTILDKFKNEVTELFNDEDTVNEIENYLKLNVL